MYELKQLNPQVLDAVTRSKLLNAIPQRYRHYLNEGHIPLILTKSGAWCGIALFTIIQPKNLGSIPYLHFEKEFQNEEICAHMLNALENWTRNQQAMGIILIYEEDPKVQPIIEKLLPSGGWSAPDRFKIFCETNKQTFTPDWINHPLKLAPDYEIFLWRELTESDRDKIRQMEAQGLFPGAVSPFKEGHLIEPSCSLGLRYRGDIIGWIIVHRISEDTTKFHAFFTLPEHRNLANNLAMLVKSFKLQIENNINRGVCEINLSQIDKNWLKFIQKRIVPYSLRVIYSYRTFKPFTGKWKITPTASI